ncbi:MAG: HXXEE domain-containing protein [Candidatus Lokiarchaeota archaeon]|nr:HXXEE domain-containing protein [Candidatus Lokiarchaeota archaeon]
MSEPNFWYKNWAKVGFISALFILLLLFLNSKVPIGSFKWLYWLSLPLYMFHQFEEYVYPGGFKEELNKMLNREEGSREILTDKIVLVVNIGFIWILTPILIVLNAISIIFPVILMTLVTFNGFTHVIASIILRRYNPGLIMSIITNIPLGLYVLISLGLNGVASSFELFIGILAGSLLHIALFIFLRLRSR